MINSSGLSVSDRRIDSLQNYTLPSHFGAVVVPLMVSVAWAPNIFVHVLVANLICLSLLSVVGWFVGTASFQNPISPILVAVVSSMAIINYSASIALGNESMPYIPGGDGEGYYQDAKYISEDILGNFQRVGTNYRGYQVVLAFLFRMFGENLFVGMSFNYILLSVSVLFVAGFTYHATESPQAGFNALLASSISPHFIAQGTILQKDVLLIFGFSVFAFALLRLYSDRLRSPIYVGILLAAVSIVGISRLPYLGYLFLFLALAQFFGPLRDRGRSPWKLAIASVAVVATLVSIPYFMKFTVYEFDAGSIGRLAFDDSKMAAHISETAGGGSVARISSLYAGKSVWVRILLAPLPSVVQYLLPFAFASTLFLEDHPWYFVNNQIGLVWLGLLGPTCIFAVAFQSKLSNGWIRLSVVTGVIMYASVAFSSLGVVPRYATPSLVMMFPAVGTVWAERYTRSELWRMFALWLQRYWVAAILMACAYLYLKVF